MQADGVDPGGDVLAAFRDDRASFEHLHDASTRNLRVVLDVDPMAIKDILVLETIKDGETIYRR